MNERLLEVVGNGKPITGVRVYRSAVNPQLFIGVAVYGEHLEAAYATGKTIAEAKTKAISEAFERYICSIPPKNVVTGKMRDLKIASHDCFDPTNYAPLSEDARKKAKLKKFSRNQSIPWVVGRRFWTDKTCLVPVDLVYFGFKTRSRLFHATSSGVAAHFDKHVATENAVKELIERDALMHFWADPERKIVAKISDINLVKDKEYLYKSVGRKLEVFQLPSPYGEVFLATITGNSWPAFVCGAGSTMRGERLLAIEKAIEEAEGNFNCYDNMMFADFSPEDCTQANLHGLFYCNPENRKYLNFPEDSEKHLPVRTMEYDNLDEIYRALDLITVSLDNPAEHPLRVIRVVTDKLVPITFGSSAFPWRHPAFKEPLEESNIPHFFP
ncbi:YcaO-like family protein [Candidatus Saccharibacteria bacterium]|nr:YcaO-like family protein [Candidatus Saccharibacteria bacterium]